MKLKIIESILTSSVHEFIRKGIYYRDSKLKRVLLTATVFAYTVSTQLHRSFTRMYKENTSE